MNGELTEKELLVIRAINESNDKLEPTKSHDLVKKQYIHSTGMTDVEVNKIAIRLKKQSIIKIIDDPFRMYVVSARYDKQLDIDEKIYTILNEIEPAIKAAIVKVLQP